MVVVSGSECLLHDRLKPNTNSPATQVKELTTRDPDPQLVSALLVCGHRPVEAVNHLLQASRFREALVLLQLRLPAHLGQPLFAACLARLAELRPGNSPLDTNGLPDCLACYIGLRNWPRTARFLREAVLRLEHRFQAASSTSLLLTASLAREKGSQLVPAVDSASASHSIVATLSDPSVEEDISDQTKALVSAAELASTLAAELLATGWLEVVLLDINQLSEALLVSLPRHAFSCLQVAFQSTEESFSLLDFLAAWATAYLKKLRPSPALAAGHLILYYGHLLASALRFAQPPSPFSSEDTRVPPAPCFSDAPNLTASSAEAGIVQALVGLTLDRQSSQPIGRSVFAQLAVDLAVCHLVAYADSNSGAEAAGTGFSTDQIACHLGQLRQTLALCARQDSVALATVSTAVRRCLLGRDSSALESERAPHVQAVVDLLQTYAIIMPNLDSNDDSKLATPPKRVSFVGAQEKIFFDTDSGLDEEEVFSGSFLRTRSSLTIADQNGHKESPSSLHSEELANFYPLL
ncbi:unnamed protein product [Protopolystoma xenopodis]|uniref:Uncharacterized protein n=1 Tax=Protopolystoma xenopodis TaxID=117903 RepID=A0A448XCJ3_9PLAT|nr:unnamed protein product [Protopolystoma xenopodis]